MRLKLTEQWPAVTEGFVVTDEAGKPVYRVKEKALSLRDTLPIRDAEGNVVASLRARMGLPGYHLHIGEREAAFIDGVGLARHVSLADNGGKFTVTGGPADFEYKIADRRRVLATVDKKLFSLTHEYLLDVPDPNDALLAVGVAVALHRMDAKDAK